MRKTLSAYFVILRDGPLEKLWEEAGGGGGAGEVQKNYLRKGKLNEKKNYAHQLILKNIHALA